jgi:hypothetical protein
MEKSRTKQAVDLLKANPGMSIYRAAKTVGVSPQVVGQALLTEKRKADRARFLEQGGYFESH